MDLRAACNESNGHGDGVTYDKHHGGPHCVIECLSSTWHGHASIEEEDGHLGEVGGPKKRELGNEGNFATRHDVVGWHIPYVDIP